MTSPMPPYGNYVDQDIERAFEWFLSFLDPKEWRERSAAVEHQLNSMTAALANVADATTLNRLSIQDDVMGWYLYLADMVLHDVNRYEPTQGARFVPLLKTIGANLEMAKSIEGIEDRVRRAITKERRQPDSTLFEVLIALLWSRNGFTVSFLEEQPPAKTPDLRAVLTGQEWFIECKRLQKSSAYSESERKKWLLMWAPLRDSLLQNRLSLVLDIVFHVELHTLPDRYLVDRLGDRIRSINSPSQLIDDETITVGVSFVDVEHARQHLRRYLVRFPSDQFNELIAGRRDPHRGFTGFIQGRYERMSESGWSVFLDAFEFGSGAFYSCDAEASIEKKARDVRGRLVEAVNQLPNKGACAVHFGVETLDGADVEENRLLKMIASIGNFDVRGKDLRWIFCHMMQSYAPPTEAFVIDETVPYFGRHDAGPMPLVKSEFAILPTEADTQEGYHWHRSTP